MAFEGLGQAVGFAFDFEDLDRLVGRAGCKAAPIVVEDCIMLVCLLARKRKVRRDLLRSDGDLQSYHHDWCLI